MIPIKSKISGDKKSGILFLDSGAHSLYTIHVMVKRHKEGYSYFESKEFWKYVDSYANFIKKNLNFIDYYANVDVIFNPELSWKVQKYLEQEHGLNPVPVIHYGTEIKWIEKHLEEGYDYLGIGGLGQEAKKGDYFSWADKVFSVICPKPSYLPLVKTHGFAMTSYDLMTRYPWFSVDSASWAKCAAFGSIYVPHKRKGKFTFEIAPYAICFSKTSPTATMSKHYNAARPEEKRIISEWLDFIDIPLGDSNSEGVTNHYGSRGVANMRFFEALCNWLPEWPWTFTPKRLKQGFVQ